MDLGLHQRTAIVLGASRRLRRAIAASFSAQDGNVFLCSRSADTLADTAALLVSEPGSYLTGSVIRVDGGLIKSI